MVKVILQFSAAFLLLAGLLLLWTPIPVGAIMIAVGFTTLIATSRPFARLIRSTRKRLTFFNHWIMFIEDRVSGRLKRILKMTRPKTVNEPSA